MAKTIVSVSFSNGFLGDYVKQNNEASNASYLSALGWSNFQFQQATDNGKFGGTQGNDLSGTILITDALGVQHRIDGVINWRAPSGTVSTMVFYATGTSKHTLAVAGGGTKTIDPFTEVNDDPHSFIGLTFNGQTLAISGGQVSGNAATKDLIGSLNTYLASQPQLTIGDVTVNEGAGTATVTVSLSKATPDTVTVKYATQNGTASAGADYTAGSGTLTFAPNQTTRTITVPLVDNTTVDGARAMNVVLTDSTFAAIVDNTGVVTINDNDSAPAATPPSVIPPSVTQVVAEDAAEGGTLAYTVSLSGTAGGDFALAVGGSAAAGDIGALAFSNGVTWKNGNAAPGTIVVPAGVGSFKVTLPTVDDVLIESPETVVLTVGGVGATGTIVDNDTQSVTGVVVQDAVEGSGLRYTVSLNAASPTATEYVLAVGGTADTADHGALSFSDNVTWKNGNAATGIVVVPANVTSFQVSIATTDDALIESSETVVLTVGGVTATGTITDNDTQSVTGVVAQDAVEGSALRYTVSLNAASPTATEYGLTVGGTASAADRGALSFSDNVTWKNGDAATGIVVVPANVTSFQVTIATTDDVLIENPETVALTVGGVTATGTITDNDTQSITGVVAQDATEGSALRYTVMLNTVSPVATEYTLTIGGDASAADRSAPSFSDNVTWKNGDATTGIVVVPANVTSFQVTIATTDDALIENPETVALTVGGITATGTIADNDTQSVTGVVAQDATEGNALRYTVSLNAGSPTATEYVLTVSGTASAADRGTLSFSDNVTWKNGDAATGIVVVPANVTFFQVSIATTDDALIESAETVVLTVGGVSATGTITDNDTQAVTGVVTQDAVEGSALRYTVALSAASPTATEYSLTIGGTAGAADRGALSFSGDVAWKNGDAATGIVVVPANVTSFQVTIATTDDALIENPETVALTVGGITATGTIADNDTQSVTGVVAQNAAEGNALRYTVTLNAGSPTATEYTLTVGGTADAADRGALSFSDNVTWKNGDATTGIVVIPANVTSFQVSIATTDDSLIENQETVVLTVGGVAATGTIADNDTQSVTGVVAQDATEGNALHYTVTLNTVSPVATEYTLTIGGNASAADRGALSFSDNVTWKNGNAMTGIVVVPANVTSFQVSIATTDDALIENPETVELTVGGITATGTIADNDTQSVTGVIAQDATEGSALHYTVTLNASSPTATEYTLTVGGTADAADRGALSFSDNVTWKNGDMTTGIVVVPANVTSFQVSIATTDDALIESAETVALTVGGITATGTLTDNDTQSVTSVVAQDATEGSALHYTVTLNAGSPTATEYTLAVGGTASAADRGVLSFSDNVTWKNGDATTGIVVVPANVTSFNVEIATTDDALIENPETVALTVGGATATATITDNDTQTVVSVLAEDAAHTGAAPIDSAVVEGAPLLYTVALSAASPNPVEHTLAVSGSAVAADLGAFVFSDGVAWKNQDPHSGAVVVPAGVSSFTVTVPTVDDALIESAETLVLTIGGKAATGTLTDNDSQSVSSVLAEDAVHTGAAPVDSAVVEGASLLYTVALSAASPTPVEHTLAVSGSAVAADLNAFVFSNGVAWRDGNAAGGIVVVPGGVSSFTVTVPTVDDTLIESAETLVLTVGGVAATGTILDNDSQSVVNVVAEDAAHTGAAPVDSTVEEGATLLYTVALNGASPMASEHTLAVSGTAGSGDRAAFVFSDGVTWKNGDAASGIIVVPAGVASFTVSVATIDDTAVEHAESLVLTVGGVAATGTIADNDRVSIASVLAEDAAQAGAVPVDNAVVEGGSLQYTVALSAPGVVAEEFLLGLGGSASAADVGELAFSDGVAWKNGDPASGIVVVPAGVGSFRITVATNDDAAVELAESLSITVGGVTGTGTITDNDAVSVASVIAEDAAHTGQNATDSSVTEGSILRYTVHLNSAGVAASAFQLAFSGTASALDVDAIAFSDGVDWKNGDAATGIIVVPGGVASFKITVATADDSLIELSESLVATVGGVAATGTITDNDSQSVSSLTAEDAANVGALPVDSSVVEGATLLFTATLNGPSPTPTEYALALGGSATAADLGALSFGQGVTWKNNDPASATIVVPAGVASFTVTLRTEDDTLVETAESVVLTIGGTSATGSILDNDSLAVSAVLAEDAANMGRNPHDSTVTEGGTLVYTVTLNAVAPAPTEFALALGGTASGADLGTLVFSDGVAWRNGDPASGVVVIPTGVVRFTVTLPTVDDAAVESSESVMLVVNGAHASGTVLDNDYVPPAPPAPPVVVEPAPQPQPQPQPVPVPAPVTPPAPVLATGLDPASDDGASHTDTVTSVRTPEFTLQGSPVVAGGSVRLLSPQGAVVGSTFITEADALAGKVNVGPGPLDDGVYTYTAQVLDASGKVVASAPVTVTVVTDLDGVMPSIELAAHGGDYNRDGILDWNQHSVAHMPLRSLADFALGKDAPVAAFGAIMAGSLGTEAGSVQLTQGAQLKDLFLSDLPAALPQEFRGASPVFNFTIGAEADVPALPDLDPTRPDLQTRVVIDLGANGAVSNNFMKFDRASQSWYSFLDDQDLATMDDGATLVDLNNDGRVDRIVLTLTDGARGDDDGVADGKIVDPGLLAFDTTPPDQVYSIKLGSGETYYTADIADAQVKSSGTGNVFQGVAFDSMADRPDAKHVSAFYQPFTHDMTFAIDGQALPYACYEAIGGASGFLAAAAGKAAVNIHLYQNARGFTELVSQAQARELGLAAQGYLDRGAQFSVSMDNAFKFDAEGYLIANQENTSVQALVKQLAGMYSSTSAAGFIDAVEQNYFEQIKLVGVAHGAAAGAADLNAVFGTGFGS